MLKRLRDVRNARGISQTELGEAVGVTQQSMHKYECTNTEPDIATLKAFSRQLDVSVDYLIENTDIARRYENTGPGDLNEQEMRFVAALRDLPPRYREHFLALMENWGKRI